MALEAILRRDLLATRDSAGSSGFSAPILPSYLRGPRCAAANLLGDNLAALDLNEELSAVMPNFEDPMKLAEAPNFPCGDPQRGLAEALVDERGNAIKMNFDHGTTTLGFK